MSPTTNEIGKEQKLSVEKEHKAEKPKQTTSKGPALEPSSAQPLGTENPEQTPPEAPAQQLEAQKLDKDISKAPPAVESSSAEPLAIEKPEQTPKVPSSAQTLGVKNSEGTPEAPPFAQPLKTEKPEEAPSKVNTVQPSSAQPTPSATLDSPNFLELIECLPLDTIEYAFAYGSGAISQAREDSKDKMVDFILVSKDPLRFHGENLQRNKMHYSFVRWFAGPEKIKLIQCSFAARVYFNTLVKSKGRLIKYGIIGLEDFQSDLLDWNWLYISGRLHKPVLEVIPPPEGNQPDGPIRSALIENRRIALEVALLQLGDNFKLEELLQKIVSHSYVGDIRKSFFEDREKVEKIIEGAKDQLTTIYLPLLTRDTRIHVSSSKIEQDGSTTAVYHRLNLLPFQVQTELYNDFHNRILIDKKQRDIEEVMFALAHRHDIPLRLESAVRQIVYRSSRNQSFKNAVTAGPMKSILYLGSKMSKWLKSVRR